ncbi:ribosome biogenesis GTPase YqeH [Virgibacillus siamensis]|uniref:ribosome biogenesis GTPase YqeH n=1 Tax=Virgibacillus siamensis TaxID=480071 RepID=UPI000985263A|nr:ribosome biogenesis GTPase YqeH [Virgibacillus siamensis]
MNEMICQGCGAPIQTTDPNQIGYTPKTSLDKEVVLCQRCFRLKHYNDIQDVSATDDDFLKMVSEISNKQGIVVHLIDIFDVEGSLLKNLSRIVGDKPIILAGNKMDLLPKSTNKRKLTQWLRSKAKDIGLTVEDVFLISSMKGYGLNDLTEAIEYYRGGRDVYIVGTTNVGKSTFINRLIHQTTGEDHVITTSYFPGTTLGFIEIPLDAQSSLIDTPGIVNHEQIAHYISDSDLKVITPKKEIKPRVFQLNSGQSLFFGGLARLDFIKGERQSFVCYFANSLSIHRTKLENADNLYAEHKGALLSPPDPESLENFPELKQSTHKINKGKTDIVFPGLGWVSLPHGDATMAAYSPKGVHVSLRKSFF